MTWVSFNLKLAYREGKKRSYLLRDLETIPVIYSDNSCEIIPWIFAAQVAGTSLAISPASANNTQPDPLFVGRRALIYKTDILQSDLPIGADILLKTSGSSGPAKWVIRSLDSFKKEGERYKALLNEKYKNVSTALAFSHAFALGFGLGALLNDGTITVHNLFHPRRCLERLNHPDCGPMALTPETARLVLLSIGEKCPQGVSTDVIIGAGAVSDLIVSQLETKLGAQVFKNYGSSETGALLTTYGETVPETLTGFPMSGVECKIDMSGLLWSRSQGLMLGYWENGSWNSSSVSPDGWFCMGDYASKIGNGGLTIGGRIGRHLRIGEQNIDPEILKLIINKAVDGAEILLSEVTFESGRKGLAVHLCPSYSQQISIEDVKSLCVSHNAALSGLVKVFVVPSFPRTPAGKIDRQFVKSSESESLKVQQDRIIFVREAAAFQTLLLMEQQTHAYDPVGLDILQKAVNAFTELPTMEINWARNQGSPQNLHQQLKLRADKPSSYNENFNLDYKRQMSLAGRAFGRKLDISSDWGRILEIGHPTPAICEGFRDPGLTERARCLEFLNLTEDTSLPDVIDTLILHNSIRRLLVFEHRSVLVDIIKRLNKGSRIIISDIFKTEQNSDDRLLNALRLEWWASGLFLIDTIDQLYEFFDPNFKFGPSIANFGLMQLFVSTNKD